VRRAVRVLSFFADLAPAAPQLISGKTLDWHLAATAHKIVLWIHPVPDLQPRRDLQGQCAKPWTSDGFRTSWGKAHDAAGINGLTFHDWRGSAVVRLAIADATVPQIATFTRP